GAAFAQGLLPRGAHRLVGSLREAQRCQRRQREPQGQGRGRCSQIFAEGGHGRVSCLEIRICDRGNLLIIAKSRMILSPNPNNAAPWGSSLLQASSRAGAAWARYLGPVIMCPSSVALRWRLS